MGHTGWLGRHPSPYSMRYTGPLEDPASPWIMGTRGPLGVPRFFMGKEQGGILEGLARPYDRCRSHGVARPICSPTHQHCVLLAGPAISSQKRTAVKPGRAAPSMPYGFLSPCLYHAVWHDMTEGAGHSPILGSAERRNDYIVPHRRFQVQVGAMKGVHIHCF